MANSIFDNLTVSELRQVARHYGVKLGAGLSRDELLARMNASMVDQPTAEELLELGIDCSKAIRKGRPPKTASKAEPAEEETAGEQLSLLAEEEPDRNGETPEPEAQPEPAQAPVETAAPQPEPAAASESSAKSATDLKAHTLGLNFKTAWVNKAAQPGAGGRSPSFRTPMRTGDVRPGTPGADAPRAQTVPPAGVNTRFGPGSARNADSGRRPDFQARPVIGPKRTESGFLRSGNQPLPPADPDLSRSQQPATRIVTGNPIPEAQAAAAESEQLPELLQPTNLTDVAGILELHPDGYGFLHSERTYQAGATDIYVSAAIVHRYDLRMGDRVKGQARPRRDNDRYDALVLINEINGVQPEALGVRPRFEDLTAVYPTRFIAVDIPGEESRKALLIAPSGFGSRTLVRCPDTGRRIDALRRLANAIHSAYPQSKVTVLLVHARPEDVTEMRENCECQVVAGSFEQSPDSLIRQVDLVVERAKRHAEQGLDAILIVDSLTRLITLPYAAGSSVLKAKKLFGSARATREAGTLTVIGMMEELPPELSAVSAEFSAAATTEMVLPVDLSSIDSRRSDARRPELLLSEAEMAERAALKA